MGRNRRMRVEPLEDRRMLAAFTVTNLMDGPVTGPGQLPGSLRQAIFDANASVGADEIEFSAVSGTISLTAGELAITDAVAIDGPGADILTIDAQEDSRVFNITATAGDFEIEGLTLVNGKTTGDNPTQAATTFSGGAIRSVTTGNLEISASTISGSSTTGNYARGGGVFSAGSLTITQSHISGNSTSANYAFGGGVYAKNWLLLTQSVITNNSTAGVYAGGGGISVRGGAVIEDSTISNNTTHAPLSDGGGVESRGGNLQIVNSLVVGNVTGDAANEAGGSHGGGIYSTGGTLAITASTISGNHAGDGPTSGDPPYSLRNFSGHGGGVWSGGAVFITTSTISGNFAGNGRYSDFPDVPTSARGGNGGGIYSFGAVAITDSTISGNKAGDASVYGHGGSGGGIWSIAAITLSNSTVSGNNTGSAYYGNGGNGGGIWGSSDITITHSTIIENVAAMTERLSGVSGTGGGIWNGSGTLILRNSIVAKNDSFEFAPDLDAGGGTLTVDYSLIGDTDDTTITGTGNVLDESPGLGPLADNGGPTFTHALLGGSAVNAGDPAFAPSPYFDQRGVGYDRVIGGRIDMGAYESSVLPPSGDFDGDGDVDGRDFLAWQRNPSVGDLNDWQENYGSGGLLVASGEVLESQELSVESGEAVEGDPGSAIPGLAVFGVGREIGGGLGSRPRLREGEALRGNDIAEDRYVEEVDRALEELAPVTRFGTREFGEMVVRRSARLRWATSVVGDLWSAPIS